MWFSLLALDGGGRAGIQTLNFVKIIRTFLQKPVLLSFDPFHSNTYSIQKKGLGYQEKVRGFKP